MSATRMNLLEGRRNYGFFVHPKKREIDDFANMIGMRSIVRKQVSHTLIDRESGKPRIISIGSTISGTVLGTDNFGVASEVRGTLDDCRRSDGSFSYPCFMLDMRPYVSALGIFFPFNLLATEQIQKFNQTIRGQQVRYIVPNMDKFMEKLQEKHRSSPVFRVREIGVMILGASIKARKLSIRGDSLASAELFWRILRSLDDDPSDQHKWQTDMISTSIVSEKCPTLSWNKLGYASLHVGKSLEYAAKISLFMNQMESLDLLSTATEAPIDLSDQEGD